MQKKRCCQRFDTLFRLDLAAHSFTLASEFLEIVEIFQVFLKISSGLFEIVSEVLSVVDVSGNDRLEFSTKSIVFTV
jgi:hypothetical protein